MKRLFKYVGVIGLALLTGTSCKDYLEVESSSVFDNNFVFSSEENIKTALLNVYTKAQTGDCLSDRISMNMNGVGSDIEIRPDITLSGRGALINLYPTGPEWDNNDAGRRQWNSGYLAINMANEMIAGIEEVRPEVLEATSPSNITHMYAEAICLRATLYLELVRNFGDIPLMLEPTRAGMDFGIPTTDRWIILDTMLEDLERVAPIMLWSSELPENAERISRGYCYGLIGRMALTRGGYSLFPNGTGTDNHGVMKRDEANWQKYYEQAHTALKKLYDSGRHSLVTTDNGQVTANGDQNNPYQQVFQNQHDYIISNESLWEIGMAREYGGNWGYAYSRFHTGGNGSNVSKGYAAIRFTPDYYYSFDDKDQRRDVTCVITGTNGNGEEIMTIPGGVGDGAGNGICLNKWDKMRMANVYNVGNGKAGINFVYMRYAEALLLLAEADAVLGKGNAKTYLKEVRSRAFRSADRAEKVDQYVDALSGEALIDAIKQELAWELGGENVRKHSLVRWGVFSESILAARANLKTMADNIRTQGYHTYPNGKQISDYVYVKKVTQANTIDGVTIGTTYGTPEGNTNPLLTPGWRGVGDASKFDTKPSFILAIQGLDKTLTATEKAALEADGYEKARWGISFIDGDKYSSYIGNARGQGWWGGYQAEDYPSKPARYLSPIPGSAIMATGTDESGNNILVNYYGFMNQP